MLAQFAEVVRPTPRPPKPEALRELEALVMRRHQLIELRTMEAQRQSTAPRRIQASLSAHVT